MSVKWAGQLLQVELPADATVGSLRQALESRTHVSAKRQKLMGMKPATPSDDDTLAAVTMPKVVLMIGCAPSPLCPAGSDTAAAVCQNPSPLPARGGGGAPGAGRRTR